MKNSFRISSMGIMLLLSLFIGSLMIVLAYSSSNNETDVVFPLIGYCIVIFLVSISMKPLVYSRMYVSNIGLECKNWGKSTFKADWNEVESIVAEVRARAYFLKINLVNKHESITSNNIIILETSKRALRILLSKCTNIAVKNQMVQIIESIKLKSYEK